MENVTLLIRCPDAPGIVAALSKWVFESGGNITRSNQYTSDPQGGEFFMRLACGFDKLDDSFGERVNDVAKTLNARIEYHLESVKQRMAILVSKHDHCLHELLYHWRTGELNVDITSIISNHPDCQDHAKQSDIPFIHIPTLDGKKPEAEQAILSAVADTDCLVLARYMQILSGDFLKAYAKPVINIHHSFLPSFIGANPYQKAYDTGVKIIGATAHYVTEDLDEGPIIEQVVERVGLYDDVRALKQKGKHIERLTLLRAVQNHLEHRVMCYGNKTVVFN